MGGGQNRIDPFYIFSRVQILKACVCKQMSIFTSIIVFVDFKDVGTAIINDIRGGGGGG